MVQKEIDYSNKKTVQNSLMKSKKYLLHAVLKKVMSWFF